MPKPALSFVAALAMVSSAGCNGVSTSLGSTSTMTGTSTARGGASGTSGTTGSNGTSAGTTGNTGTSGTAFESFCAQDLADFTTLSEQCEGGAASFWTAEFAQINNCLQLGEAIANGHLVYNAANAPACLNGIRALTCEDVASGLTDIPACDQTLVGTVSTASNCTQDADCVSGDFCTFGDPFSCPGTCTPKAPPNAACSANDACTTGYSCQNGDCTPLVPLSLPGVGDPCVAGTTNACQLGLNCDAVIMKCATAVPVDGACAFGHQQCAVGSSCSMATNTCTSWPQDAGGLCGVPSAGTLIEYDSCYPGLYCNIGLTSAMGTCSPLLGLGLPCGAASECESNSCTTTCQPRCVEP